MVQNIYMCKNNEYKDFEIIYTDKTIIIKKIIEDQTQFQEGVS